MMQRFKSSSELKAMAREHLLGHYGTVIGAELIMLGFGGSINLAVGLWVDTSTVIGTIIYYAILFFVSLLMGLFTSGTCYLYLKLICGRPVRVSDLFYGFQLAPDKAIAMQAWITLITYAASLPQIILTYRITAIGHTAEKEMSLLLTEGFDDYLLSQTEKIMPLMLPYALSLILSGVVSVVLSLLYAQMFYLLHDFPQYTAKELLKKSRRLMVHHKGRLFYLYVSFLPLVLLGVFSFGLALLWVIPYITATRTEFFLNLIQNNTEAAV